MAKSSKTGGSPAPAPQGKRYWLVKSEPFKYSWDQFVKDGSTCWDGVRNNAARLHLKAMQKGDQVFFYHSNEGLEIVGIAKVTRTHYPDPTSPDPAWVAVDLQPVKPLRNPVSLSRMKADKRLAGMALIRIGRLSVSPVTPEEYAVIMELASSPD